MINAAAVPVDVPQSHCDLRNVFMAGNSHVTNPSFTFILLLVSIILGSVMTVVLLLFRYLGASPFFLVFVGVGSLFSIFFCRIFDLYRDYAFASVCMTIGGGNKSKFKKRSLNSFKLTRDHDVSYNTSLLFKYRRNTSPDCLRRLRGMTVVVFQGEEIVCDYPVYQTHVFTAWLKSCPDFASFRLCSKRSTIPYELLASFVFSYPEIISVRDMYATLDVEVPFCETLYGQALSGVSLQLIIFLNKKIVGFFGFTWKSWFFVVLLEESHKWFFGMALPVAEIMIKVLSGGPLILITSIWPFLMHFVVLQIPWFSLRCVVHFLFNILMKFLFERFMIAERLNAFFATALLGDFSGFDQIRFVASTITLIEHVIAKDVRRFTMSLVSCGWAEPLYNFLREQFNSVDDFFNYLTAFMEACPEELGSKAVVALTSSKVINLMRRFLPKFISDSPAYSAVITLVSCLLGSFAFSNLSTFIDFLPLVDFSKLSQADLVATAIEASMNIVAGIRLAFTSGDFKSFFYDPKSYVTKIRISRALGSVVSSEEENIALKKECSELLEICARSSTDVYFTNQCVPLETKKNAYDKEMIKNSFVCDVVSHVGSPCTTKAEWEAYENWCADLFKNSLLAFLPTSLLKEVTAKRDRGKRTIRAVTPRRPPIMIWMMGSPGVGKTEAMINMARFIFNIMGKTFDVAEVGNVNLDDKYPAETVQEECKVIVVNDLTGDHSQDTKTDKTSLGVVLQAILDTTPLFFKSAAVERKSFTFKPDLVFVNSNEEMFSTCESTLRLERRFFANAIIASYEIREKPTGGAYRNVPFKEYVRWSTKKRNDQTYIQLRTMVPIEKKFSMVTPRGPYQHVTYFYKYLRLVIESIPIKAAQKAALDADCCPCGVGYCVHFAPDDSFVEYSDVCIPMLRSQTATMTPPCQCGLPEGHAFTPLIDHLSEEEERKHSNNMAQMRTGSLSSLILLAPSLSL